MLTSRDIAATTLQKYIRGQQARAKYKISHLSDAALTSYQAMITGNDPEFDDIDQYATSNRFAVIGTSGLRSIEIAGDLAKENQPAKIIILDNSAYVYAFWMGMKRFAAANKTKSDFLAALPTFICANEYFCALSESKPLTTIAMKYFTCLFIKYDFNYICRLIANTTIIRQTWEDTDTLINLKNILTKIGIHEIYMYPSNIVAYYDHSPASQEKILRNIAIINPKLCIHTDMIIDHPQNAYLVTDHTPTRVKRLIEGRSEAEIQAAPIMPVVNIEPTGPSRLKGGFFNRSPHDQLLDAITSAAIRANILKRVTHLLNCIREKNYSKAVRTAANDKNGLIFIKIILDFKATLSIDINEPGGETKNSALHLAAIKQHHDIYHYLIQQGANTQMLNHEGKLASDYIQIIDCAQSNSRISQ